MARRGGRRLLKFALTASLFLVSACAETYGPAGSLGRTLTGGGYKDRQIDNQLWEVEYSGANYNYDFVYNSAVRRSAEIAKREGFPYFTVVKISDSSVPNYSGTRYVGATVFIKLRMRGWRAYQERCSGDKVVRSTLSCDLYDTARTLGSRN
jgi:hypothetical protein